MKSNQLLISFIAVSIVSLLCSGAAVFACGRAYNELAVSPEMTGELLREPSTSQESGDCDGIEDYGASDAEFSASLTPPSATASAPTQEDTATAPADTESAPVQTDGDVPSVSVGAGVENQDKAPSATLSYSNGRLLVTDEHSVVVYELTYERGLLCENDAKQLLRGISFSDTESAIMALYDLIS